MSYIAQQLEQHTANNSGFETSRNYLSLSHAYMSVDDMVKTYIDGFPDSHEIRMKCYKGYQMERDLKARIKAVFGKRVQPGGEISAHGGMVQGHPDLRFDDFPLDCKAVPLDEHLPQGNMVPKKVWWQMNGYMLYMKKPKGLVIYESRETGRIIDIWVFAQVSVQESIDSKFREAVQRIQALTKKSA
jgi:hypothetical protein